MRHIVIVGLLLAPGLIREANAQNAGLRWSGLWYADYYYVLRSPDQALGDQNGFTFRRLYLTADWSPHARLRGRVRLEADDRSFSTDGRLAPFLRDLYVQLTPWKGHWLTIGICPTPAFEIREAGWGYRSLERTILDLNRIVSTRDFGLSLQGPITGEVSYWLMFGNNSGLRLEQDKFKRLYGGLSWQRENGPALNLYTDYGRYQGGRWFSTVAAYAGLHSRSGRMGLEAFAHRFSRPIGPGDRYQGISLFGVLPLGAHLRAVGRGDLLWRNREEERSRLYYALVGLDWSMAPELNLIPNLYWSRQSTDPRGSWTARITLYWRF
nr:MAG: hypothetical protein KatS3mg041_1843 [Bacteroidota bacterium]